MLSVADQNGVISSSTRIFAEYDADLMVRVCRRIARLMTDGGKWRLDMSRTIKSSKMAVLVRPPRSC